MAAWDKDLDKQVSQRPAWEADLDSAPTQAKPAAQAAKSEPGMAGGKLHGFAMGVMDVGKGGGKMLRAVLPDAVTRGLDATDRWLGEHTGGVFVPFDEANAKNEAGYQAGREEQGRSGFDVPRMAGQVAATWPVGGILGRVIGRAAPMAGPAAPIINKLAQATQSGGMRLGGEAATTFAGKVGNIALRAAGGALNGGVSTAMVDPEHAGTGALFGGAIPLGVLGVGNLGGAAGRLARSATAPLYEKNDPAALANVLKNALGPSYDDVVAKLYGYANVFPKRASDMLPDGYAPTAAEVARTPTLSALQRTTTAIDGAAKDEFYKQIVPRNQNVLIDELGSLAGRDGAADFTRGMRDATSRKLYGEAYKAGIDPAMLTPEALQNIATFSKRVPDDLINEARKLAKIHGESMTDANSLQGMHWVKQALDDAIQKESGPNGKDRILYALTGLKQDLLGGMDELSSAYQLARKTHAEMSVPVNQFDTLEEIAKKAIAPTGDSVRRGSFAQAVTDQTAKRATGFENATLENVLTPEQMQRLGMVRNALDGIHQAANVGRMPGAHNLEHLASAAMLPGAGQITRAASRVPGVNLLTGLAGRAVEGVYGKADARLKNKLAEALLDPEATLQIMNALRTPAASFEQGAIGRSLPYLLRPAPVLLTNRGQ